MGNYNEWMEHFKKLSPSRKKGITNALSTLEKDPMIRKEYGWTRIFELKDIIENSNR